MNHECTPKCVAKYGVFAKRVAQGKPVVRRRGKRGKRK